MLNATQTALQPLSVHRLTRLPELLALRTEWDELLSRSESASVFQTWEWVTTWYEHFGDGKTLWVLTVRDRDGRLVGIAPWSRTSTGLVGMRFLHLLGRGNQLTEYVDVILQTDVAAAATEAIFEALRRWAADWDLLVLPTTPADGPFIPTVRSLADRYGYRMLSVESVGISRPLPGTWEEFYRSLRKSMKSNVNNYVNRLHREGHDERMVVVEDPDELDAALDTFLGLHRRRAEARLPRRHKNRFASPAHRAFLYTVARRLLTRGKIWPCFLYVDGQPVAAQICLLHAGRVYTYYSGFDPDWAFHGVMMVLTRRCIERAIESGYREVDMLLGMDQEKLRWGCQPRPVTHLTLASPRLRSQASLHLYRLNLVRKEYLARRRRPKPER
jgi:CelD/BcsL family acetyltransferase involved in cellulose biosynthesis